MAKITISDLTAAFASTTALNSKFQQLEDELNNKVLYRANPTGEPNSLANDVDMAGFNILNQGNPISMDGFVWEGPWLTTTVYTIGDVVQENGTAYICIVNHTAGVFVTDLAALKWEVLAQANLPSQTGNVGKALTTNGSSSAWSDRITSVADKTAAVLITPTAGRTLFVRDSDGGLFKAVTGAAVSTYSDNGGSYCGTQFIPTGGDGSTAWVRDYSGAVYVEWFGAKLDASMNAAGVLSGTDDATAIQNACNAANSLGVFQVYTQKSFRMDSQINIPAGVHLFSDSGQAAPVYRVGTGYEQLTGSVCFVNFGSAFDENNYTNAAWVLNNRSKLSGLGFWYPGQDMSATTPTSFPPTIITAPTAHGAVVENLNTGNSYSFIDTRRDHTIFTARRIVGYPIKYGIRFGSNGDLNYLSDVHFHPFYGYRGSFTAVNSLVGWIAQNGTALDLGRVSYLHPERVFAFGYNKGVNGYYQALDAGGDVNNPGGVETANFIGCSFDSCYYPYYFTHETGTGNVNYGVTINGGFVVPKDPYNAARVNPLGVYWDTDTTGGLSTLTLTGGLRFHAAVEHVMDIINADGLIVDSSVKFIEWDTGATGSDAIRLTGCKNVDIAAYFDGQSVSGSRAVHLISGNEDVRIKGTFKDFVSKPVLIDNAGSNIRYHVTNNTFDMSTAIDPVQDDEQDINSFVGPNNIVNGGTSLSNSDVDGSNILQIWAGQSFVKYTGTTNLSGIKQGYNGQELTVHFSNAVTVTDGAAVGTAVLKMTGDFVTTADDIIKFTCDGSAWYEGSRSIN